MIATEGITASEEKQKKFIHEDHEEY